MNYSERNSEIGPVDRWWEKPMAAAIDARSRTNCARMESEKKEYDAVFDKIGREIDSACDSLRMNIGIDMNNCPGIGREELRKIVASLSAAGFQATLDDKFKFISIDWSKGGIT